MAAGYRQGQRILHGYRLGQLQFMSRQHRHHTIQAYSAKVPYSTCVARISLTLVRQAAHKPKLKADLLGSHQSRTRSSTAPLVRVVASSHCSRPNTPTAVATSLAATPGCIRARQWRFGNKRIQRTRSVVNAVALSYAYKLPVFAQGHANHCDPLCSPRPCKTGNDLPQTLPFPLTVLQSHTVIIAFPRRPSCLSSIDLEQTIVAKTSGREEWPKDEGPYRAIG